MATMLLKAKGHPAPLGPNWIQKFFARHSDLRSSFSAAMDRERNTIPFNTVTHWLELFRKITAKYQVQMCDTYNMDEKGFARGQQGKQRTIVPESFKPKRTQNGNREWVSLIETVSTDSFLLPPYIIFKGKIQQAIWHNTFKKLGESYGRVALSENGWTDNELGLEWLNHFDQHTKGRAQGEYHCHILDGHDSHINTAIIELAIQKKIILLCLPPHTTHLLQPLDVGIFGPL